MDNNLASKEIDDFEVILYTLVSPNSNCNYLRDHMNALDEIIETIEYFHDPDECMESILSIEHGNIFLILDEEWSILVEHFCTISHICYIYLRQAQNLPHMRQVRGVYPDIEQLVDQLKLDIRIVLHSPLHLSISSSGESNMHRTLAKSFQPEDSSFCWSQVLLDFVLVVKRPTDNIHQDLLDEARHIYKNNNAVSKEIGEFEKSYKSTKAIRWYTRDSFIYRILNMALAIESIVIIWKFRYIIQDIFHQLDALHKQQTNQSTDVKQRRHTVYRGQRISPNQLKKLQDSVGHIIVTNSFMSTSKSLDVAMMFAGGGADRPKFESIILEIDIDESEHSDVPITFADITDLSFYHDEGEVLISMGATFRVESVVEKDNTWWIRVRTYPYENPEYKEFRSGAEVENISKVLTENSVLLIMGAILYRIGAYEKVEEIRQLIDTSDQWGSKSVELMKNLARMPLSNLMDPTCRDIFTIDNFKRNLKSLTESYNEIGITTTHIAEFEKIVNTLVSNDSSKSINTDACLKAFEWRCNLLKSQQTWWPKFRRALLNRSSCKSELHTINNAIENSLLSESLSPEQLRSHMNKILPHDDQDRIVLLWLMSKEASDAQDNDRAIQYLQESLSMSGNHANHVYAYYRLADLYQRQEKWTDALNCYQSIINIPQWPKNSPACVKAHIGRGEMLEKFEDYNEAFSSYTHAYELRSKHCSAPDLFLGVAKVRIANLFRKLGNVNDAIKSYQEAIEVGDPEVLEEASLSIGMIYMKKKDYDGARIHFRKYIEIIEVSHPDNKFSIGLTHTRLSEVEHYSKHYMERDFHINEALTIATSGIERADRLQQIIWDKLNVFSKAQLSTGNEL